MVFLLPVGGVGWNAIEGQNTWLLPLVFAQPQADGTVLVVSGTAPFIPCY